MPSSPGSAPTSTGAPSVGATRPGPPRPPGGLRDVGRPRHRRLRASLYLLQSAGRPYVASAAWRLIGEGRLDLGARVADVIEEFGTNGEDVITVAQVLTHTAGIPFAPMGHPKMADRRRRLEAFARWRLDEPLGRTFQFHLTSPGWLIAELVERLSGRPLSDYLQREVAGSVGLRFALGMSEQDQHRYVAPMVCTDGCDSAVDPWGPWYLNDPAVVAAGEPSHAVIRSARCPRPVTTRGNISAARTRHR